MKDIEDFLKTKNSQGNNNYNNMDIELINKTLHEYYNIS